MNRHRSLVFIVVFGLLAGCASRRLPDAGFVRGQIEKYGLGEVEKGELQIRNISLVQKNQAIVETTLPVTLQLSRPKGKSWQIDAVRLGDRNWIELNQLLAAIDLVRARVTRESLENLARGLALYKAKSGVYPMVENIRLLTDLLVPEFMSEVIRFDGWNREIRVEPGPGGSLILRAAGPDGKYNSEDDILVKQ
jgi:hypothetical protein